MALPLTFGLFVVDAGSLRHHILFAILLKSLCFVVFFKFISSRSGRIMSDLVCTICYDGDATQWFCQHKAHRACVRCFLRIIQMQIPKCPICRRKLNYELCQLTLRNWDDDNRDDNLDNIVEVSPSVALGFHNLPPVPSVENRGSLNIQRVIDLTRETLTADEERAYQSAFRERQLTYHFLYNNFYAYGRQNGDNAEYRERRAVFQEWHNVNPQVQREDFVHHGNVPGVMVYRASV